MLQLKGARAWGETIAAYTTYEDLLQTEVEEKERGGWQLSVHFSPLLYLGLLLFSVLQAQASGVFPKQHLGTNSKNV